MRKRYCTCQNTNFPFLFVILPSHYCSATQIATSLLNSFYAQVNEEDVHSAKSLNKKQKKKIGKLMNEEPSKSTILFIRSKIYSENICIDFIKSLKPYEDCCCCLLSNIFIKDKQKCLHN